MRVLLTGGAGYIGAHTAVELLERGDEVVLVDNYANSSPKVVDRIEAITGRTVTAYRADAADAAAMEALFTEQQLDAVIHFAGLKAVGESVAKPLAYYRNNLDSTLTLLETMERHGVKRLIFSSSATVYGTPKRLPLTEDQESGVCTNPYGWTKAMIEQILRTGTTRRPIRTSALCCCATSTPWAPMRAAGSGKRRTASPTT